MMNGAQLPVLVPGWTVKDWDPMDSFEFNKIAGAVLSALLIAFGSSTLFEIMGSGHASHDKPGYQLEVKAAAASAGGKTAAPQFDAAQVVALVATADAGAGAGVFARCKSCHLTEKSGRSLPTGPNLWGVVGRRIGTAATYDKYSPAFKGQDGAWDYASLAKYLHNPRDYIPNNRMSFAGIKDTAQLASLIAYLRSLADTPAPLPN